MLPMARKLDLVGVAEVAAMLGTSRPQVSRFALREDFPEPVARLRMGPIWMAEDVKKWASGPRPDGRRKR